MQRRWGIALAVGTVASFAVVPGLAADSGNKYDNVSTTRECGDDSYVTYNGPEKMWPPNHKYVPLSVTITDESGDNVTIATEGTHNQYEGDTETNGSGHTADDVSPPADSASGEGTATTNHNIRSERSGRIMEGRTYTITYEATAGDDACMGSFTITVPHDMRGGADWK